MEACGKSQPLAKIAKEFAREKKRNCMESSSPQFPFAISISILQVLNGHLYLSIHRSMDEASAM